MNVGSIYTWDFNDAEQLACELWEKYRIKYLAIKEIGSLGIPMCLFYAGKKYVPDKKANWKDVTIFEDDNNG